MKAWVNQCVNLTRSRYGACTALMMFVCPEPGIQPVTTITMSPDLKNPRAFPVVVDWESMPVMWFYFQTAGCRQTKCTHTYWPMSMPNLTLLSTSSAQTGAGRGWKRAGNTPLNSWDWRATWTGAQRDYSVCRCRHLTILLLMGGLGFKTFYFLKHLSSVYRLKMPTQPSQ